ncbi:MAG: NAD-binding protein [Muribaculaceae bacterium]
MRYLIIGLGIYGANLARDLTDMGHEVIGADRLQGNIDAIKDYISTTYLIDSTEEAQLQVLPLKNIDLAIVAIGENFGASVKTVALLKHAGVNHIYARAIDPLHQAILESFEIDRIVTPEQRAAADLAAEMALGVDIDTLSVDKENIIARFAAPEYFIGLKYSDLGLEKHYGLSLIAATRKIMRPNIFGVRRPEENLIDFAGESDETVSKGDTLTLFGSRSKLLELYRQLH